MVHQPMTVESRVLELDLRQKTVIPRTHAESLHRQFLSHVNDRDRRLAAELHGGRGSALRQFTISSLFGPQTVGTSDLHLKPGRFMVRFTALGPDAVSALDLIENAECWRIAESSFTRRRWRRNPSEHPWAFSMTEEEMLVTAIRQAAKQRDRIETRFWSPTAFSLPGKTFASGAGHFPDPALILGSLRRKFTALVFHPTRRISIMI